MKFAKPVVFFCAVALISAVFLGCGDSGSKDEWTRVTSFEEIRGNWEGSETVKIPKQTDQNIPESSMKLTMGMEFPVTLQNYTGDAAAVRVKIDMEKILTDYFGNLKDTFWDTLINTYSQDPDATEENGVVIIDSVNPDDGISKMITKIGKYYMEMTTKSPALNEDLSASDGVELYINQNKTKLKFVSTELVDEIVDETGFEANQIDEVILYLK
ncbi:hypothetical protein [Breznakiella homolactica]|uniref:Lipoprotein n=1 Tax=Breznakiella homolactica TaxID=2798577 RepID=A0A7T7XQZ2_9SPIR|nr:hypothetical protein [Breznakiella homolactica]QQO10889.1 hypothetical protein JFL75_08220 [Breznakiella homolactica]